MIIIESTANARSCDRMINFIFTMEDVAATMDIDACATIINLWTIILKRVELMMSCNKSFDGACTKSCSNNHFFVAKYTKCMLDSEIFHFFKSQWPDERMQMIFWPKISLTLIVIDSNSLSCFILGAEQIHSHFECFDSEIDFV